MTTPEERAKNAAYMRKWNAANWPKVREQRALRRAAETSEQKEARLKRHREYSAASREKNGAEWNASRKAVRHADPEAQKERAAAYRAANPEKVKAWGREWARKESSKARKNKRRLEWRRANPLKAIEENQARRRLRANAPGRGVSAGQWRSAIEAHGGRCAYCGAKQKLCMDHVHPLSKGGAHDTDNILPACKRCNTSKGNKTILMWLRTSGMPEWREV